MAGGLKPPGSRAARRRAALLAVVVAVAAVHLWVSRDLSARFDDLRSAAAMPARIEVAYVKQMEQTAPVVSAPAVAVQAPAAAAATSALAADTAASQAEAEAAERKAIEATEARARAAKARADKRKAEQAARAEAKAREDREARARAVAARDEKAELEARALVSTRAAQAADAASQAAADASRALADASAASAPASSATPSESATAVAGAGGASAIGSSTVAAASITTATTDSAVPPDAAASGARPFEWPVSTRVSYVLTGYYRGDVQGWAKVEWVKAGSRYQVHLDVTIGPDFAPIIYRRMSSDGEITPAGLSPRRYDEETKVVFRDVRRNTVILDRDHVTLPDGSRHDRRPNMQDQASQFVQLTYLFSTRPGLLATGRMIDLPLALPRKIDDWQYEVLENETIATPFGPVPAVHVRPRKNGVGSTGTTSSDLTAEVWFAPTLAYLPVRIRIQQVGDNFLDLVIAKPPEQAGR
ncbi:MAG: hypothetical protein JWQ11_2940 [Rhizobacter sp.]|nr:hypothetical protein [Rhizobacter sp.]